MYSLAKSATLFVLQILEQGMCIVAIDINFSKHVKLDPEMITDIFLNFFVRPWFLQT